MNTFLGSGLLLASVTVAPLVLFADEQPPAKAKPLLEIVTDLEKQGYTPIVEASFDDGVWEVEVYREGIAYELAIDPLSGEILSEHRDEADEQLSADSMLLSDLLKHLEEAGFSTVSEISFERQSWEVEAIRNGQKRELRVDPMSGGVISNRIDD